MDNMRKEEPGSTNEDSEKGYTFINQTIRKKPVNKKKWLLRVLLTAAFAVGFGVVAALVFAAFAPTAAKIMGLEVENKRIVLTTEGETTPTPEPEEAVVASSSEKQAAASSSGRTAENAEDGTASASSSSQENAAGQDSGNTEPAQDSAMANTDLTLDDFQKLYGDILDASQTAQHALVQVTGITSEMDYFQQNYENSQQASGLIIAENNNLLYILTQQSVVDNVQSISIAFFNGTSAEGSFLSRDSTTGFAVVTVDMEAVDAATLSQVTTAPLGTSYLVSQADPVIAIGNPMGYGDSFAYGVITSISNTAEVPDRQYQLLTTDITGSTSGSGILINIYGKVVGIISQNFKVGDTGTVTALAISDIKDLLETLTNNEPILYAGITGQEVTEDISARTGIPKGELVTAVAEDSPAMLAGIKEYDVITEINGRTIHSADDLTAILDESRENDTLNVRAMRRGAEGYAEVDFVLTVGVLP